jgi:hypothetical protein
MWSAKHLYFYPKLISNLTLAVGEDLYNPPSLNIIPVNIEWRLILSEVLVVDYYLYYSFYYSFFFKYILLLAAVKYRKF